MRRFFVIAVLLAGSGCGPTDAGKPVSERNLPVSANESIGIEARGAGDGFTQRPIDLKLFRSSMEAFGTIMARSKYSIQASTAIDLAGIVNGCQCDRDELIRQIGEHPDAAELERIVNGLSKATERERHAVNQALENVQLISITAIIDNELPDRTPAEFVRTDVVYDCDQFLELKSDPKNEGKKSIPCIVLMPRKELQGRELDPSPCTVSIWLEFLGKSRITRGERIGLTNWTAHIKKLSFNSAAGMWTEVEQR